MAVLCSSQWIAWKADNISSVHRKIKGRCLSGRINSYFSVLAENVLSLKKKENAVSTSKDW